MSKDVGKMAAVPYVVNLLQPIATLTLYPRKSRNIAGIAGLLWTVKPNEHTKDRKSNSFIKTNRLENACE